MKDVLQHFRKEEEPFIEKVQDWIFEVNDYYTPKLLDFLNPRERFIVESLVRQAGLELHTYGGFENAERERVIIAPDYFVPTPADFQIQISAIKYPEKFATIEHRDVLGSMMALGVDRAQFGDIILDGSRENFDLFRGSREGALFIESRRMANSTQYCKFSTFRCCRFFYIKY